MRVRELGAIRRDRSAGLTLTSNATDRVVHGAVAPQSSAFVYGIGPQDI